MGTSNLEGDAGRRQFLRTAALTATVGATGMARPAAAQADDDTFETWFENVDNYDGVVDRRGHSEVHILVGAAGNGGAFAFDPAAVRIDPGTTVIWEWTGDGGQHNVYDEDVGYESPMQSKAGATYALTFNGRGVSKYACAPHEAIGMKGAIVVGDPQALGSSSPSAEDIFAIGGGLGLVGVLLGMIALEIHSKIRQRETTGTR